jgi:hypothetical protein
MKDKVLIPSHLSSKIWLGELNGWRTKLASIGLIVAGKVSVFGNWAVMFAIFLWPAWLLEALSLRLPTS